MWLHIVIFVILFLLAAGSRLGWLHVEQIGTQKGRKLFLAVALTGNIMGLAMTCTKGGGEIYQDGYELKNSWYPWKEKKQAVSTFKSQKKKWKRKIPSSRKC